MLGKFDWGKAAEDGLITPFREHLDHCAQLAPQQQLEECADYIQHVDLLVSEFLESYYLVERLLEPDSALAGSSADSDGELVLEPFYESLEIELVDPMGRTEGRLVCVSGAVSSLPEENHPALSRRGLDFIGLRDGENDHIVLGAVQSAKEETPFLLLLRALNALAEISPPLRIVQLGREIMRGGIPENVDFSLLLGVSEPDPSPESVALNELTRDLAEAFGRTAAEAPQLAGMLRDAWCVASDADSLAAGRLRRSWRVAIAG